MNVHLFKNKKIIVIGDIILDEFWYGNSDKNSSEYEHTPIVNIEKKTISLGGSANVVNNLKALNATSFLVGFIPNGKQGIRISDALKKENISTEFVQTINNYNTTTKTRVFINNVSIARIDDENCTYRTDFEYKLLFKNFTDCVAAKNPDAVIIQDYNKGCLNAWIIAEIINFCIQKNIFIAVDPKKENWNLYKNVDLFKPNLSEFESIINDKIMDLNILKSAEKLQSFLQCKNLLITLGKNGNFLSNGNIYTQQKIEKLLENPSICGAGDTVIAVATLAFLCNFSLEEIGNLCNKAGFLVCQKKEIETITLEELELN